MTQSSKHKVYIAQLHLIDQNNQIQLIITFNILKEYNKNRRIMKR